jgi:DNA-binding response OmpR family regulator
VEVTPIPEDTETKCYKILLIEDDQSLNEPLQYALQQQGYEVRSTTDGRDVTGLLDLIDPDLVVTDIIMPDIDMLDLITSLRLSRPQIKIIAISGNMHLLRLAARHGADHVLPKPFRIGELNALVKRVLA